MLKDVHRKRFLIGMNFLGLIFLAIGLGKIGNLGTFYLTIPLECYLFWKMTFAEGLADYSAKLIRSRNGKAQYKNASKIWQASIVYGVISGIGGCLFMLIAAAPLSKLYGAPQASYTMYLMSAGLMLSIFASIIQGYFHGMGFPLPGIATGVLEQVFFLVFCFLFMDGLGEYGRKVGLLLQNPDFGSMYDAGAIGLAFTCSSALTCLFCLIIYFGIKFYLRGVKKDGLKLTEDLYSAMRNLAGAVFPVSAINGVLYLTIPVSHVLYIRKAGFTHESVIAYGAAAAQSFWTVVLLALFIKFCYTSAAENCIKNYRKEEYKNAKGFFNGAFLSIMIQGIFFAVILLTMAPLLEKLLFAGSEYSDPLLIELSAPAPLLLGLNMFFTEVLLGTGKKIKAAVATVVAVILQIVCCVIFMGAMEDKLLGLLLSLLTALVISVIVKGFLAFRTMKTYPSWWAHVIFPIFCGALAGLVCILLKKVFLLLTNDLLTVILVSFISLALYIVGLFVMRVIRARDLHNMPGGEILRKIAHIMHLI